MYTFLCPKITAGSLYTCFLTNKDVFDTNDPLLRNTNRHFPKMKWEKVNATLHLLHFSPVNSTAQSLQY